MQKPLVFEATAHGVCLLLSQRFNKFTAQASKIVKKQNSDKRTLGAWHLSFIKDLGCLAPIKVTLGAWHLSFPIVQPTDQTLLLMTQGHEGQNQPASQME